MPAVPGYSERLRVSEVGKAVLMAGLVLLACAAVLLFGAYGELRKRNADVQLANTALLRIEEINSLVIGVDYSARGYALTGQQLFLDHENQKQARLKSAIAELAKIVDPAEAVDVKKLAHLAEIHARIYADFVASGPGRTKEIAAIITDPVLRKRRYDVLAVLDHLHRTQLEDLYSHQAAAEYEMRFAGLLTLGIVVLAFLSGVVDLMARMFGVRRKLSRS